MTVFVDTDVVISSFISKIGAAFFLLNTPSKVKFMISDQSQLEITRVAKELEIRTHTLNLDLIKLTANPKKYSQYVLDKNDSHIIAAAHQARTKFLLSYNLKHFRLDLIKNDLEIIIFTPAQFLQYLRSQTGCLTSF